MIVQDLYSDSINNSNLLKEKLNYKLSEIFSFFKNVLHSFKTKIS